MNSPGDGGRQMNQAFAFLSNRHPASLRGRGRLGLRHELLGAVRRAVRRHLSGAGWDVAGSDSQHARQLIEREPAPDFPTNLVAVYHSEDLTVDDAAYSGRRRCQPVARSGGPGSGGNRLILQHGQPAPGERGRHDDLRRRGTQCKGRRGGEHCARSHLRPAPGRSDGMQMDVTGQAAMWADFNRVNKESMLKG